MDAEVHVRFLVALPLLILAELVVHKRMRPLVQQFLERHLVLEHERPRWSAKTMIPSSRRLLLKPVFMVQSIQEWIGHHSQVVWSKYSKPA